MDLKTFLQAEINILSHAQGKLYGRLFTEAKKHLFHRYQTGYQVSFKDGNKTNQSIKNLILDKVESDHWKDSLIFPCIGADIFQVILNYLNAPETIPDPYGKYKEELSKETWAFWHWLQLNA